MMPEDDFELEKVYSVKDRVIWNEKSWEYVGKTWVIQPNDVSKFYTQMQTIGMYPGEGSGWREL